MNTELVARIRDALTQALPCCTEGSQTREAVIGYLVTGEVTTRIRLEGGGFMGTAHRVHREACYLTRAIQSTHFDPSLREAWLKDLEDAIAAYNETNPPS